MIRFRIGSGRMPWIGLFLCLFLAELPAQTYSSSSGRAIRKFEKALECYGNLNRECAVEALLKAIRADETFTEAYRLLSQIHYEEGNIDRAIGYYERALEIDPEGNPDGYRILASLTLQMGYYERTLELIETFLAFPPSRISKHREGYLIKEKCLFALEAMENPVPFKPENLGDSVNSPYSEYWPSLTVDDQILMFTVMLPKDPGRPHTPSNLQEDFYYSERIPGGWGSRQDAGKPLNTPDNEGAHTMTATGGVLFFTACNRRDGKGQCDIYVSGRKNGGWKQPANIGSPVNTRYSEKHPTISADGRRLFFSSNRPGGKGSYDIWVSKRVDDGWGVPFNLGDSVNTPGLEQSPFIHPDQQTLYFSSDGWPGMGQGDLYVSRLTGGLTWSAPVNLGYPLNTHNDEIGLTVNARGNRAYFASDRASGSDTDIYTFVLPSESRPVRVSYMKGRVYDARNMRGLKAQLQLIDLDSEEIVMEMESKAGEGDYLVPLPTDRDYALNVSSEGYLFYSDHFAFKGIYSKTDPFRKDIPMERISAGSRIVLRNIFFDTDSHELKPESVAELHKIRDFLVQNPGIEVEIGGHTDDTGTAEYNQKLSEKRADAVVQFLVGEGIAEGRLHARGYGETEPVAGNETEEGRAANRRTELKILGTGTGKTS